MKKRRIKIHHIQKNKEEIKTFIRFHRIKKFKNRKKVQSLNIYKNLFIWIVLIFCLIIFLSIFYISKRKYCKINIDFPDIPDKHKLSYDEVGERIYFKYHRLSFDILDEYYYGIKKEKSNFNHIHLLFAFDNKYHLLASIGIASILKTASDKSYIHFHTIATSGFKYEIMKKLNSLKYKLNNNSEFIFYEGNQTEIDFGEHIKNEKYGVGEYAKVLGALLIDKKVNKVIALDAGDILVQKDLLELYNTPFDNYLVMGVPDPYSPCCISGNSFYVKEDYINGGVVFYNLKKWRELNIYQDILNFYKYFNYKGKLPTPHQDFINCFIPSSAIGLLPLKYNHVEYIYLDKDDNEQREGKNIYLNKCSYYYGKKKLVFDSERNVVIRHFNQHKINNGRWNSIMTKEWQYYGKMTGFYEEICQKYPKGCK